jgi:predicted XRE-type DNA-binding protein
MDSMQRGRGFGFSRFAMEISEKDKARFWSYVDRGNPDECWQWKGGFQSGGYGCFNPYKMPVGTRMSHRIAWVLTHGKIKPQLQINHRCGNRSCCNPSHLYAGTQKENMRDRKEHGREQHGSKAWNSKLTEFDIKIIFELRKRGLSQTQIAPIFGVTSQTISHILSGKGWSHISKELSDG